MNAYSSSSSLQYRKIISGSMISNRYLVQSILGEGEFGCTYLAVDSYRFYEPCVLKEFDFAFVGQNDDAKEKLLYLLKQEAEVLYKLDHCQIIEIFASFTEQGRFFLVQEYVKGQSYGQLLQRRIQQGQTFKETEIISWLTNLLLLLAYIHDRGVIHRHISLHNIIQSDDRYLPTLINFDFGRKSVSLLKQEDRNLPNSPNSFSSSIEVSKSFANRVYYAPYEQIKLGLAFPCSDLYALGVNAIVLLTGKHPSLLVDRNTLEWRWYCYTQVSESLTRVINKLLAYNPKHRYQSATEVLQDLQPLKQTQHCSAKETSSQRTNSDVFSQRRIDRSNCFQNF